MPEKEKKEETEVLVVSELPVEPRRVVEGDGKKYELITFSEALTEILLNTRKIANSI